MPSLAGKRALVTGGSRGLGAAIALQLSQRGAKIAINYAASKDRAQETLDKLEGTGHTLIQGDAFTREGVKGIAEAAVKALGGLDVVISNAGWTKFGAFHDINATNDADWMQCYTANVMSHLWLMQDVETELKANKGCFIISSSVTGIYPGGSSMAYSVSKAGANHLAKSLAKACAPDVRVNAVAPGVMLTEWGQGFSPDHLERVRNMNALKQISEVEDVARAYVALAENGAQTGQVVEVSSGFRMA